MAQLTVSLQVDVTECVRLREQLVRLWASGWRAPDLHGFRGAGGRAGVARPSGAERDAGGRHAGTHATIDVGLAVDAPEGLIVPVLRGADGLALRELAQRRRPGGRAGAGRTG